MERWQGRVAVVTGASKGIGAYIAEDLLRAGMKVVGLARKRDLLDKIAERANGRSPGSYYPVTCDLAKEADILAAFAYIEEKFETVHVLVNCAAVLICERIIECNTEKMRNMLDVNVLAVAICTREASKLMRKHKVHGHVINVNSVAGHEAARVLPPVSLYCASKYAITGMTESLRNEFYSLDSGIKISSISPGPVKTDMIRDLGIPEEFISSSKILDPQDVTDAVLFALSTPPHVQVNELKITPLDESFQRGKP